MISSKKSFEKSSTSRGASCKTIHIKPSGLFSKILYWIPTEIQDCFFFLNCACYSFRNSSWDSFRQRFHQESLRISVQLFLRSRNIITLSIFQLRGKLVSSCDKVEKLSMVCRTVSSILPNRLLVPCATYFDCSGKSLINFTLFNNNIQSTND